jgi:hypothetical protein
MKAVELVAVPLEPTTAIAPSVAPAGTTAVICVGEFTVNVEATPLKSTEVTPAKFVPVMTTVCPTRPLVGENDVTVEPGVTVKSVALAAEPAVFVTVIRPVVAPAGTVAVILVEELTVKVAETLLKRTAVTPVKFVPLMVTLVWGGPEVGVNDVMDGAEVTTKSVALVPVPTPFVTVILPVVAAFGTVAVIWVSELTVNAALTPSNLTVIVPVKSSPEMTTVLPTGPLVGLNDAIVGEHCVTVKFVELVPVPTAFVTEMGPVVAPTGTTAVIRVEELTLKDVAAKPLNLTAVAPVKLVPVRVTVVPTQPLVGVNEVIDGAPAVTLKLLELVAVPCGVWTEIAPVEAPAGTVAVICVEELTVNVADVPAKRTEVAPVKFVPVMTTDVPAAPLVGLKLVIVGPDWVVTSKLPELVAVPDAV